VNRVRKPSRLLFPLFLLVGLAATLAASLFVHVPDRPVATIEAGSSSGPAFVVQVRRPRMGLPLGGVLPPGWFGVDERLVFGSDGAGAEVGEVGPQRVELRGEGWELALAFDAEGRVSAETQVVFELVFEERLRRVRARAGEPAVGVVETTSLSDGRELWGRFDVELARCEDAATGEPLGWPPEPLVLHGSFDRLPTAR
jgi:hypothetical protein